MRHRVVALVAAMVVIACSLFVGCSSTGDGKGGIGVGASIVTPTSVLLPLDGGGAVLETAEGVVGDVSPFVVKVGSGYLRDLMDGTFGADDVDYSPLLGADYTLDNSDVVVAGYLFEIVAGVTEADVSVPRRLTETEIRIALADLDERERSFEALGATAGDWSELEQERPSVRENQPPRRVDFNYSAYRVLVTEVFKGDISVGDVLDVQVYAGVNMASEWVNPVLEGTPRVVVAGFWGDLAFPRELRNAAGEPIDEAFWSHTDLFWLDEGVWEILVDDSSGGTSVTGESSSGGSGGSGPGDLLEDDTPEVGTGAVTGESLVERPAPVPEAHYLDGLNGLDEAWGVLETLDELAAALRTAAAEVPVSTTTTTVAGTTSVPGSSAVSTTTVGGVVSTTVPVG